MLLYVDIHFGYVVLFERFTILHTQYIKPIMRPYHSRVRTFYSVAVQQYKNILYHIFINNNIVSLGPKITMPTIIIKIIIVKEQQYPV